MLPRQNWTRQNVTRQNVTRQIVTRQNVAEPFESAQTDARFEKRRDERAAQRGTQGGLTPIQHFW